MVRSVDTLCRDCGKKLAHWDMFSNFQYEEEWECLAKFRRKVHGMFRSVHNRHSTSNVQRDEFQIPVKTEMNYCSLYYHTKYCRKCAGKRHFKCGRPKCNGKLFKVRESNGKTTKHTHGGW